MSLQTAIFLDILVVCAGAVTLHFAGGLRLSHPAVLYLMFHVLVFTARGASISLGAPTFFSNVGGLDPPSLEEITQALIYADAMLVAVVVGWVSVSKSAAAPRLSGKGADVDQLRTTPLSDQRMWWICGITGSIGIYAFSKYAFIPGGDPQSSGEQFSDLTSPSTIYFLSIAMTWPGLVLLILIYRYGFRFYLLVPMAAYLIVIAVQGYDRFRLVIPLILLCMIFLDRRGRRWPGVALIAAFLALVALFVPLKSIGRQIQTGGGGDILSMVNASAADSLLVRSDDQVILDELALTIALADQHGRIFFGAPYVSTLLLPVPRSLWPDKPSGAGHIQEISTSARPLRGIGGVTTLVGDLYLNFRLPGLLLIAFWLARRSGVLHRNAYRHPYLSVQRFSYLLFASILVQVFRDGLLSLPLFLLVHFLPLTAFALVHVVRVPASRIPAPDSVGGVASRGAMVGVGERGLTVGERTVLKAAEGT